MREIIFVIISGLYVLIAATGNDNLGEYEVQTSYGVVRGSVKYGVLQFFDIPYGKFEAANPFQEPVAPGLIDGIHHEEEHKSRCPQMEGALFDGNEKCLTLSVFTPNKNERKNLPVLFHIHDCYFASGSGDPDVYAPKNLVDKNIIVILPNYRLGPLGFMCLLNEAVPGNAALKDLARALRWTKNEIANFGGDPSNIVVSGTGAGGALAEYLLISNVSRNYISRAITESGSSLSPWAIDRDPLATASPIKDLLNKTDIKYIVGNSTNIEFRPCIEKEDGFITESPWRLLKESKMEIAYMVGTANHAAWKRAVERMSTDSNLSLMNRNASVLLPNDLVFQNEDERLRIGRQVRSLYFGARNITMTDVNQLSQLITDSEYLNPGVRGARLLLAGGAKVYFYEYSFNNSDLSPGFNASTRGNSLDFVFSEGKSETVEEGRMRNIMTELWASFINTGTPSAIGVTWNPMKKGPASDEEWLSIGATVQLRWGLYLDRLRLWQEIYDRHFIDNQGFVQKPMLYVYALTSSVLIRNRLLGP